MIRQKEIILRARSRGFHLVTQEIVAHLEDLPDMGILILFIKHTSAGLTINENADPSVRVDFDSSFDHLIREDEPYYTHTFEGADDMPAHLKSSILGSSIHVPITDGRLNMGAWQGIYLCEHRNHGKSRTLVLTAWGE